MMTISTSLATTVQRVRGLGCWGVEVSVESAAAWVCREAGARVSLNVLVRDLDLFDTTFLTLVSADELGGVDVPQRTGQRSSPSPKAVLRSGFVRSPWASAFGCPRC